MNRVQKENEQEEEEEEAERERERQGKSGKKEEKKRKETVTCTSKCYALSSSVASTVPWKSNFATSYFFLFFYFIDSGDSGESHGLFSCALSRRLQLF